MRTTQPKVVPGKLLKEIDGSPIVQATLKETEQHGVCISPTDQAALLGVALAGIVTIALTPGAFDIVDSLIGIILLVVLRAYKLDAEISHQKQWAFRVVQALCVTLILGVVFEVILSEAVMSRISLLRGVSLEIRDIITIIAWIAFAILPIEKPLRSISAWIRGISFLKNN